MDTRARARNMGERDGKEVKERENVFQMLQKSIEKFEKSIQERLTTLENQISDLDSRVRQLEPLSPDDYW